MAAWPDLEYLHRIAVSDADRRLLHRIAEDRKRVLAGELLPAPGEYQILSLDPGQSEDHALDRGGVSARTPLTLLLRSDLAPASLDTFLEVFRDAAHTRVDGFAPHDCHSVVDIGANEGFYSLFMKYWNARISVVAAEPVADVFALLEENMARNVAGGVTAVRTAIVGSPAPAAVELDTYPHVSTIASRDLTAFPRPWIDPSRIRRERVPATTLRDLLEAAGLERADILKLDVEGSEAEILGDAAARGTLARFDRIVCECHGHEVRRTVRELVETAGFVCVCAEENRSGDLYFHRRRRRHGTGPAVSAYQLKKRKPRTTSIAPPATSSERWVKWAARLESTSTSRSFATIVTTEMIASTTAVPTATRATAANAARGTPVSMLNDSAAAAPGLGTPPARMMAGSHGASMRRRRRNLRA
jgi:FkbM family methyltransferase